MMLIELFYTIVLLIAKLFLGLLAFAIALLIFIVAREVSYTLREQNKKKSEDKEHESKSI